MQSFLVGHKTLKEKGTGLTVFLFDQLVSCGVWVCGSATATREMEVLSAEAIVPGINGLLLSGGSAFGLDAAHGVMKWLKEKERGVLTPCGVIPIVPTACVYDLHSVEPSYPSADDALQACLEAKVDNIEQGRIGVGTGVTVGKLVAGAEPMQGGFGVAEVSGMDGLLVRAYVVVNAMGDIVKNGEIIAGAKYRDGSFANTNRAIQAGEIKLPLLMRGYLNTTLGVIVTNAKLSKIQLTRVSKMAGAGMGRAISPVFTSIDGDMVFSISVGEVISEELSVGVLSALALQIAIENAVST